MFKCHRSFLCDLFEWKLICKNFSLFVYICNAIRDPIIKKGQCGDATNRFNPVTFFVHAQSQDSLYIVFFFAFIDLSLDEVVRFVDIGEIVDYHCFKLSFYFH